MSSEHIYEMDFDRTARVRLRIDYEGTGAGKASDVAPPFGLR